MINCVSIYVPGTGMFYVKLLAKITALWIHIRNNQEVLAGSEKKFGFGFRSRYSYKIKKIKKKRGYR
jgi:hypothetical protein